MSKDKSIKIEFTIANLFTITLFFLSLYFLWAVRGVMLIVFIAFIISSALSPIIKWLEGKKLSKPFAIIIIYLLAIIITLGLVSLAVFPLTTEISELIQKIPSIIQSFIDKIQPIIGDYLSSKLDGNIGTLFEELAKQVVGLSGSIWDVIKQAWGFVGTLVGSISVVILSLYILLEHDKALSALLTIIPLTNRVKALKIINEIEEQMGRWLRGQLTLSLIIGLMTWIAVEIIGLPFALPLAIIAGCLEIIPNLGPTLAAIPAFILVVAVGTVPQMIAVPIVYWLIQQVENTYIVPQIMKKAVGLNPLITMIAFLIGAEVAGISGMLLAVPVAAVIQILIKELGEQK